MFSCEFWEISKNTFSYRTPLVAASDLWQVVNRVWLKMFSKIKVKWVTYSILETFMNNCKDGKRIQKIKDPEKNHNL